jgi:hypothetical protein
MDLLAHPYVKNHHVDRLNHHSNQRDHVDVVQLNVHDQGFFDQL